MSDKDAYELMVKYSGGEKGITMIREMIHLVGVDRAVENMCRAYKAREKNIPSDFRAWMFQAFNYLSLKMSSQEN